MVPSRVDARPSFDVDDLPLEAFDLAGSELDLESLTTGYGLPEHGASVGHVACSSCPTCSYCCGGNEHT